MPTTFPLLFGDRWGVNRSIAQIHALLYLADEPLPAETIAETLGLARSNVSTALRELQGFGLVETTHLPGDRRDRHAVAHGAGGHDVAGRAEAAELEAVAGGDQRPHQGLGVAVREAAGAREHAPRGHERVVGGAVDPAADELLHAPRVDGVAAPGALDDLHGGERDGHRPPTLHPGHGGRPRNRW